jgi:dihydrofolate synthase/folylpolyglutamate synthase
LFTTRREQGVRMTEPIRTYRKAEDYINGIVKFSGKNSMEHTKRFLAHLGNPADNRKIIHIAGTNGKGSVCAYLCSVLRQAGISAGMFISPHLVTMRERIVVDGNMISEEEFLEAFREVRDHLTDLPPELAEVSYHPSFFEFLFFMAMVVFEKRNVEYIVLETGLGGRLDATNSVERKEVCVLTSIGYDHMEYLGDTLEQIASEKAGILRNNTSVVYPVKQEDVAKQVEKCALAVGAKTFPLQENAIKEIKIHHKTIDFSLHLNYYGYISFTVSTVSLYQVENASLAIRALALLNDERITVPVMQTGIRKAFWEGRMEEILPNVYLDGAHNVDGVRAFIETVRTQPCGGKRRLLYSVVKDKQYRETIDLLASSGLFDIVGLIELSNGRALPLNVLEDYFGQYTELECKAYETLDTAFDELVCGRGDEDNVYIVGSLYLVGEVKALLRRP